MLVYFCVQFCYVLFNYLVRFYYNSYAIGDYFELYKCMYIVMCFFHIFIFRLLILKIISFEIS